jgi:magnesium transporter
MLRISRRSEKAGLPPGTPVYVGKKRTEKIEFTLIDYDRDGFERKALSTVDEMISYRTTPGVSWINIEGLHESEIIEKIGGIFEIHPLVVEDILNTDQRPKMDIYDDYVYIVMKMHSLDEETGVVEVEQVSMILGNNFVLTFQEQPGDIFDPVRLRIADNRGRIRKSGPDYLAYALLDAMVDSYFGILQSLGDDIEDLEDELLANPTSATLGRIHFLKREMAYLRKSVWPLRELINILKRQESELIRDTTVIYLNDLYDHTIQVIDTVETLKDILAGVLDIYLSSISNRMNEIMKVLTVFAAIFIPLTLIAGIYGMNFDPGSSPFNMPELKWYFGYPFALGLMATIGIVLFIYFKRKNWF